MTTSLLDTLREFFNDLVEENRLSTNPECEKSEVSEISPKFSDFPRNSADVAADTLCEISPSLCEISPRPAVSISAGDSVATIDFETVNRSGCLLASKPKHPGAGAYRYLADPATEVIVLSHEIGGEARLWDPEHGLTNSLAALAADPDIRFLSHNSFDLVAWNTIMVRLGFAPIPAERWIDTMAICAYSALPHSLDGVLKVLGLPIEKDKEGKRLTLSLSRPNRKGLYPGITPEVRARVGAYCHVDREGAAAIYRTVGELPEHEREVWRLDQRINARAIRPDLDLVHAAKRIVEIEKETLIKEFRQLTGTNPSQIAATREWLAAQDSDPGGLSKGVVAKTLKDAELPDNVRRALELRLKIAPSSVAKLDTILACVGFDGRIRGALQYHGATTGRWAGRLFQAQNLPRQEANSPPAEELVPVVLTGDPDALRQWGDPIEVISKSLRAVVVAEPGSSLAIGDFSTIELRLLLQHAGDTEKIARFATDDYDPYREFAALLFGATDPAAYVATSKAEMSAQQKTERQTAKPFTLGSGYNMGAPKFSAKNPEIPAHLVEKGIRLYRQEWAPLVPQLWNHFNACAVRAMLTPGRVVEANCGVRFERVSRAGFPTLVVRLINGKQLFFVDAHVHYDGNWHYQTWKNGRWIRKDGYGGLLTAHIISATARELLVDTLFRIDARGWPTILTVHDEVIIEDPSITAEMLEEEMSKRPQWAIDIGLPVAVEAWTGDRYWK